MIQVNKEKGGVRDPTFLFWVTGWRMEPFTTTGKSASRVEIGRNQKFHSEYIRLKLHSRIASGDKTVGVQTEGKTGKIN